MALLREKVAVGYLVQTGFLENGRVKATYLNPDQYARALSQRYYLADSVNRLPDVTTARVITIFDTKKE